MSTNTLESKPHYPILDGLRGVAALLVVAFHLFEAHSAGPLFQILNHGYLAVDFFFLLSGFVIAYAYDDRWGKMSIGNFFKRRLIRLQPMVIMGMIIGALLFYFQDSVLWPTIHEVPVWKILLVMVIGFTLIPVPSSLDIRGWAEMHPLNGPGWSLFYEYIANILYALFVRKFSKTVLSFLACISGTALIYLTLTTPQCTVIGGWSLEPQQIQIGVTRMMYPFFAGVLLFRMGKLIPIKNAFFWSSLFVILALAMPRIGGANHLWLNGLYESFVILFFFPFIVSIAAGGAISNKTSSAICRFLGDISYPIYITHYPIIYIYTAWVADTKTPINEAYLVFIFTFLLCILVGYTALKLYDIPVRKWITAQLA